MKSGTFEYKCGDISSVGFVSTPDGDQKSPLVLIAHSRVGCDAFVKEKTRALARLGYVGFAMDLYGEGRTGATKKENEALMTPLVENRDSLRQRLNK